MAHVNRHHPKKQKPRAAGTGPAFRAAPVLERKVQVVYGKPFILLEDEQKDTFVYSAGQWVRHAKTIAELKQDCQVKQLAQKINGRTRYEVCLPVVSA